MLSIEQGAGPSNTPTAPVEYLYVFDMCIKYRY